MLRSAFADVARRPVDLTLNLHLCGIHMLSVGDAFFTAPLLQIISPFIPSRPWGGRCDL